MHVQPDMSILIIYISTEKAAPEQGHQLTCQFSRGVAFIVAAGAAFPSPQLLMGNPFQGHIETVLVIQAMPANWSDFTVCAHQELDVAHVLGEAHVLKDEHVINQPVLLEEIAIRIAAISESGLLSHGGKEKLSAGEESGSWLQHPGATALAQHRLPVSALG